MAQDYTPITNSKKWNRKVIKAFWMTLIIYLLGTSIHVFIFDPRETNELLNRVIIYPSIQLLIAITLLQLCFLFVRKYFPYILIAGSHIICAIIMIGLYEVQLSVAILIFPIFIAVIYFNRRLIYLSFSLAVLTFWSVYFLFPKIQETFIISHIITMMALLIMATLLINMLLDRGVEILENLKHTNESQQDLMIRNIIMEKLAKTDALTDIYNHMAFHEYLEAVIKQCKNNQLSLHLAIIDIDNFKRVNDTYGHRVGDLILYRVAQNIKNGLTSDDFVARYGGEEFVVILTNKSLEESVKIIERIRTSISEESHEELGGMSVTVSIGMHTLLAEEQKEDLFEGADSSLYVAKRSGKNRTIIYKTPSMDNQQ